MLAERIVDAFKSYGRWRIIHHNFDGTRELERQFSADILTIFSKNQGRDVSEVTISEENLEIAEFLNSGKVPLSLRGRYLLGTLLATDDN